MNTPWKYWTVERIGWMCAGLAALGFSFKAIFVKLAYAVVQVSPVDSITLLTLRMLFSLPVLLWLGWYAHRPAPALSGRDWGAIFALGILGYYGASILDFMGLQYITASLERLILFTYPTLTLLIGMMLMGKTASRAELGALVLSSAGIGLSFSHDLHFSSDVHAVLIGSALVLGAALSYAFYQVGSEPVIHRIGTVRFTACSLAVATVITLIHFVLTHPVRALIQPTEVYFNAAGMALFSTVLPVFLAAAAVERIGAARTALIGTLGPVLTIFFSIGVLNEPLSMAQCVGASLVVAGVVWLGHKKTPPYMLLLPYTVVVRPRA